MRNDGAAVTGEPKPARSEADCEAAMAEVERLWGAKAGTPRGDRLDVLATLIDAWEAEHPPMAPLTRSRP
jgi:HTH-type transcriptional regulator/antitoxin HigA